MTDRTLCDTESRPSISWGYLEAISRRMFRSSQVASAYVVTFSFAMHAFFMPYKKLFQNVIELVVLFNYTILLLSRSTQTFLDSATSLGYTGTAVRMLSTHLCTTANDAGVSVTL